MQVEIDLNDQLHGHRMTLVHGRLEPVLPHSFNGLVIQAHAKVTNHVHVLRIPLAVDDELNRNASLEIRSARFGRELRIHGMNHDGSAYAPSDAHYTSAVAAAASGATPDAVPCADAAAQASAESRPSALALRCQRDLGRIRHAQGG